MYMYCTPDTSNVGLDVTVPKTLILHGYLVLKFTILKYVCINNGDQRFFQFEIFWNVSVSFSASFEYLCYASMAILSILILSARGSTLDVRIWRLQTSDSDV